jgi:hypothetical protein
VDDVGQDRKALDEIMLLGDEADAAAQPTLCAKADYVEALTEQQHLAGGRFDETEAAFEQGGLSRPVGADQGDLLAAPD